MQALFNKFVVCFASVKNRAQIDHFEETSKEKIVSPRISLALNCFTLYGQFLLLNTAGFGFDDY